MPKRKLIIVALASLMTLGAASPALADCCDSFWDCGAAVVTEGVSCAIQEFIDTVKGLVTFVANLMSEATGATGDAKTAAQQTVQNTIDAMTSQSQSSAAELKQADDNGKKLASEEKQFKILKQTTVETIATTHSAQPVTAAPPPATQKPVVAAKQAPAQSAGSRTTMRAVVHNPNLTVAPPAAPSGPPLSATINSQSNANVKPLAEPARSFMQEMDLASAEISKARAAGDQDLNTVNQQMTNARTTEGTGIKSANAIADQAIEAPFKNLMSQLTSMLANPTDLTSPSSAIEAAANSIMGNLNVSVSQVIDAITAGPNQAFQAAQPSYTDLQARAEHAQKLASAMDVLYRDRTPAALAALNALLPRSDTPMGASARMPIVVGHVPFNQLMTTFAASNQKTKAAFMARFQGFSQRMTQYEAVRVKARSNRGSVETYKSNFSTKLNSYLTGKTPAELAVQRDSLIAEARKHFANDLKTRDAMINLLSSETAKRSTILRH